MGEIKKITDMTDKELLELAAGAYHGDVKWNKRFLAEEAMYPFACFVLYGNEWNPLESDGDALRLAVECGITVLLHASAASVGAASESAGIISVSLNDVPNACAATRRAIVLTAARLQEIRNKENE